MKISVKYIIFLCISLSCLISSSTLRSLTFPGWGELNEYNILSKSNKLDNIEYIKNRSRAIMITEGIVWIGLIVSNELTDSYKNDFMLLAQNNAGVNWSNIPSDKFAKYAANVGNFDSMDNGPDSYNNIRALNSLSIYDIEDGYQWDWSNNNSNRLRYDKLRNKSEKFEKLSDYIVASLLINRIYSAFNVLNIKRNHGRMFSLDLDEGDNMKFNFNYRF